MTASEYSGLYAHEETMWWFVAMRRLADAFLAGRSRAGMRTLDAGCGAGYNALDQARRHGWEVFPCDYSPHALQFSARRGIPRLAGADVERLPYADASFDCVTCFDVLVMFNEERLARALGEFHRVLRPGGLLLTRSAAMESLRGHHSLLNGEARRYSLAEFRGHLGDAGFAIERATYANTLLAPLAFRKRRIFAPLGLVNEESDVGPSKSWLEAILLATMNVERKLIVLGVPMPFGTSTVILSRK